MDYFEKLTERYESAKQEISTASDIDGISKVYTEAMNYYCTELIPEFFSSRGEGRRIRDMYQNLETYKHSPFVQESAIETVDLNIASCAYQDYLSGMRKFIEETCACCIDGETYAKESTTCEENLAKARENDGKFIESIFGGCNNEKHSETVLEAAKNVEFLIDFMENMKVESAQCGVTIDEIKKGIENHQESQALLMETAKLMTESMNDYVYHAISHIFESYKGINDVLTNKGRKAPSKPAKFTVW